MYDCEIDGNSCNFCFYHGYCKYDGKEPSLLDLLEIINGGGE